ncbi:MAG TPA: DUF4178 domain-containing protein [Gemmataceae bacterium]|nr:DUF4178 domain-containing protein [Gemmataceae bacterium]
MSVQVNCPACGGPITFTIGSAIVAVCPYCRSVVARGDRGIKDLGKVAALAETGSPLRLGLRGRYKGVPFELVGRAQIGHAAGGVWDEWYAHFADDRWGWLAEAQGRFYFTFPGPEARLEHVPPYENLRLGTSVDLGPGAHHMAVAEVGTGHALSAAGQIPYQLVPNETYTYADVSGPNGEFATIDYSEAQPLLFLGQEIELEALGIPETELRREHEARHVAGVQLACPHCGGPLTLRAPDRTERVTCPNCGSLLDVNQGQLSFFKALAPTKIKPAIPIGKTGQIEGLPFVLIGFMQRSVKVEGTRYPWEEYLLYHPQRGFRWLVRSNAHWNLVRPLPPGQVHASGRIAHFEDREFKLFQAGNARVDYVLGEFYWKVEAGERAQTADFIRPPEMLSREVSRTAESAEINWSLGTYLPVEEVEKAFGVTGLPRPLTWNVAPNQPFPYKGIYGAWAILSVIAIIFGIALRAGIGQRVVLSEAADFPAVRSGQDTTEAPLTSAFDLRSHRTTRIQLAFRGPGPQWLGVEGELVNQSDYKKQLFTVPVTPGSSASAYESALPAGTYRLRLIGHVANWTQPINMQVTVVQGAPRARYLVFALVALALLPLGVLFWHYWFEQRRWSESDFGSSDSD